MPTESNKLHPSVQQFKQFVKEHPLLIREVRSGNKTWQEYYEEWTLLGAEHPNWERYRKAGKENTYDSESVKNGKDNPSNEKSGNEEEAPSSITAANILGMLKNINFNDLQHHMAQVSSVITNVQGLMQSFQGKNQPNQPPPQDDPFSFRRH